MVSGYIKKRLTLKFTELFYHKMQFHLPITKSSISITKLDEPKTPMELKKKVHRTL